MSRSTALGSLATFAMTRHGALTRRQAAALGAERMAVRRLIDRGALREPCPGVLVIAGSPDTWQQRLYVAVLAGGEGALAIGASAARLHRVDGFEHDESLHIAVRRGRRVLLPGVTVSQTVESYPSADRVVVDGIECAGLARTVCDVAPMGADVIERMIDDVQRRGHSLIWIAQTAARLRTPGRAGIPAVEAELERRRTDTSLRGSWFEKLVEECVRRCFHASCAST